MKWYNSVTWLVIPALLTTVVAVDIIRRALRNRAERKGLPLPPGPSPLPVVGNALSLNPQQPWMTFTGWGKKYGDIIYIRLLGTSVIVLNSPSVASDLMEKRSRLYSDRPFIVTVAPYGHDCNFGLSQYGDHWRLCRRIFQQTFRADAALSYRPMQLCRSRQLIINITDKPDEYPAHFSTFAAAVAMSAIYDYEPTPRNDPMVSHIHNFLQTSLKGLAAWKMILVKTFPFLLHVPEWLPLSWISREAKEAYEWRNKMVNAPYRYVQERMVSKGQMGACMVSEHISLMEKYDGSFRSEYETALKCASTTAYLGSAETTSSTLMTFVLAMVQTPRVWKRAQADIDTVVGTDRLPEFDDRPSLPYIDAIIRETLRWVPVLSIGVPHVVTHDDVYDGYFIPKGMSSSRTLLTVLSTPPGSIVIGNTWGMSRNEARYPDADKYIPERFLNEEGMLTDDDPGEFVFGFGRRRCPGRYVADASLWSAIVTMLATLNFDLAKDADGNDVIFEPTFTSGIDFRPNAFPCRLALRSHVNKEMLYRALVK